MNARTDVHRPSAPEFDPALYDCRGVFDTCTDPLKGGGSQQPRLDAVRALREQGYTFGPGSSHQCGHCGAHIRYCALMVREDVKQFIYVGETCLDGRFELTKGEFDALRKAAQLDREKQRLLTAYRELCERHQALAYASYAIDIIDGYINEVSDPERALHLRAGAGWALSTMADIARKARKYGDISDKQVAFLERLLVEVDEKIAARIAKDAEIANKPQAVLVVTGKRQLVEGTVISRKDQENPYSYNGGRIWKILVEQADGSRVWGTEPGAFVTDKGDRVKFMAAVKVSDKDPGFGFYSRPTGFEVVERTAAEEVAV
jgi:hypothetical protein